MTMKRNLLLLGMCCFLNLGNAQTLEFSYDNAGNQVKRELVTISINSLMSTNNVETEQEEDTLLPESKSLNDNSTTIEFYPNPVVDLLNVEWDYDLELTELMIFDNQGKLLQIKKVNKEATNEVFNFSTYASGVYYVRAFDAQQQSKSYKIIKK